LINADKINFSIKEVNIELLEQYKPEYKNINPISKVPAMREINHGKANFIIFESHAIMKYICQRQNLP
jgi:glutathione S-transferase